jgi:hypothetical protein
VPAGHCQSPSALSSVFKLLKRAMGCVVACMRTCVGDARNTHPMDISLIRLGMTVGFIFYVLCTFVCVCVKKSTMFLGCVRLFTFSPCRLVRFP